MQTEFELVRVIRDICVVGVLYDNCRLRVSGPEKGTRTTRTTRRMQTGFELVRVIRGIRVVRVQNDN
jgi:hypothetical protein